MPIGVAVALVVALAAGGCRGQGSVFPGAPVVLVSIDTLRADRLPAYGSREVETPAIDALAEDGIVFDTAISHVPLTLPSHATLFTGLLPFATGVRDNLGYRLGPAAPTLAGILAAHGYATGGAVSAVVLDRATGISRGFGFWDDAVEVRRAGQALGEVQRPGGETEAILEDWIGKATSKGPGPLFAFLHIYEPHAPYEPPAPFAARYAGRPYDGEVAAADAIVGRFVDFLRRQGIYDRAVVVLLSDHGEGLGDHGEAEHGIFLYREEIQVPLIVKLPGGRDRGRRVAAPAGLVDVLPTILAAVGIERPAGLPGAALWPEPPSAPRRIYSETMFPRFHFGWSDLASLCDGASHYVHAPRPELYDWKADPRERHDLSAGLPPALRSMRAALEAMSRPLELPGASDPETVKKLASLGYIGAGRTASSEGPLPDPKDRIAVVGRLRDAARLAAAGDERGQIELLRALVRENPEMLDAREALSRALRQAGLSAEAYRELVAADRLQPGTPQVLLGLAQLAIEVGRLDDARRYARAAEAAGSRDSAPVLCAIAIAAGDVPEARARAEAAARERPTSRVPWMLKAQVEARAGNAPGVLEALDRMASSAPASAPPLEDASYLRGDALARLGRADEARAAFRAEIRDFPQNPRGATGLALLEASEGRMDEARQALSSLLDRARVPGAWFAAARAYDVLGERAAASRTRAEAARRFPGAREEPTPPATGG